MAGQSSIINHQSPITRRRPLRVALVHDLLTQYGGAERILEQFMRMFPEAPVYTLIYDEAKVGRWFPRQRVRTSTLQHFPASRRHYKWYLPLMPWATERIELPTDLDLVLSDASAYAKGVRTPPGVPHLCYLHTPTRYLWSVRDAYLRDAPIPAWIRPLVGPVLDHHKRWDYLAAQRPTNYIVNSRNIRHQLQQYYDRDTADVVFPFVEVDRYALSQDVDDYVLLLGRLEPYKRADLVLEACRRLGWPLKVAGSGSWLERYRAQYRGVPTIEFLGRVPDEAVPSLLAKAKVFVFPAEEDAGITPLEAMASGCPVLAYAKGGALESIRPGMTGQFFSKQTPAGIAEALRTHDWSTYDRATIRAHARQFDVGSFTAKMEAIIARYVKE